MNTAQTPSVTLSGLIVLMCVAEEKMDSTLFMLQLHFNSKQIGLNTRTLIGSAYMHMEI